MKSDNAFLFTILVISSLSLIQIGHSNEVGIIDGIFIEYKYKYYNSHYPNPEYVASSTIEFTKTSNDFFHVKWKVDVSLGSWDVNLSSRVVSNMVIPGPDNGTHDFSWIYTNVSLNDQFLMFNFFSLDDHEFNVTGEATYGSLDVWELRDNHGSICWYEKTKGFFVNGTFRFGLSYQKFEFIKFSIVKDPGFPFYYYFFIAGGLILVGIVIWVILNRYKMLKKR